MSAVNDFTGKELATIRRVIEKEIRWLKYVNRECTGERAESNDRAIELLSSATLKASHKLLFMEAVK